MVTDMYRKLQLKGQRHKSCRHMSMFTIFRYRDDHVLLTMYPAELQ